MKCAKCGKKSQITTPFGERNYCERHYVESINKRIRKDLRIHQKIDLKSEYYLKKEDSHEYFLTKHFLKNIFKDNIKYSENNNKKIILSGSLDKDSSDFFNTFLENTTPENEIAIVPLRTVLQSEMKELCRILKINYKNKQQNFILDELEKKYPGTKFSVRKSKDFINKKNKKIVE